NNPAAAYCSQCGARIDDETLARAREREQHLAGHLPRDLMERFVADGSDQPSEMRQVTMVFVDLVRSTEIVQALGGEEMSDLRDELFDSFTLAVDRFGGTVAELAGDGALCLFGAPSVHEDDPERALRAALNIQQLVSGMVPLRLRGMDVRLQVRIGIHTGT